MYDIDAIQARWRAATPGPWMRLVSQDGESTPTGSYHENEWYETNCIVQKPNAGEAAFIADVNTEQDAIAISAAPFDIMNLLSEVKFWRNATYPYLIMHEREGVIGIVEATDPYHAWRNLQEDNPGKYDGSPDDHGILINCVSAEWCNKMIDALAEAHEKIGRLTAELAGAPTMKRSTKD